MCACATCASSRTARAGFGSARRTVSGGTVGNLMLEPGEDGDEDVVLDNVLVTGDITSVGTARLVLRGLTVVPPAVLAAYLAQHDDPTNQNTLRDERLTATREGDDLVTRNQGQEVRREVGAFSAAAPFVVRSGTSATSYTTFAAARNAWGDDAPVLECYADLPAGAFIAPGGTTTGGTYTLCAPNQLLANPTVVGFSGGTVRIVARVLDGDVNAEAGPVIIEGAEVTGDISSLNPDSPVTAIGCRFNTVYADTTTQDPDSGGEVTLIGCFGIDPAVVEGVVLSAGWGGIIRLKSTSFQGVVEYGADTSVAYEHGRIIDYDSQGWRSSLVPLDTSGLSVVDLTGPGLPNADVIGVSGDGSHLDFINGPWLPFDRRLKWVAGIVALRPRQRNTVDDHGYFISGDGSGSDVTLIGDGDQVILRPVMIGVYRCWLLVNPLNCW